MSPMTLMELPPLRMEGLTRESVFVDQALSSASSYTVTPIWELSESSGSAAVKGLGSNLKTGSDGSASERATPTTPPTSAGTAAAPSPSPSPNANANADTDMDTPPKPRLELDFGLGEGDEAIIDEWNSSPSQAQTPFNSPASKANPGSQQPFIYSTLFAAPKSEGDSDSNSATPAGTITPTPPSSLAFIEEVDRWLAYIEKSLSQLERRHLRLNVA
ncbi:hypothetical protein EST38_g5806 [Candolleomyces aberdarensis]|uniref:Uncharacterized protein n=1 Tax=Candolleomyces aberdarensis TaxID=2316362 RepID=A0A4Q2DJ71_9AGAR|nr:hypothetical protein EST38_g5806 [Candolleomyces aberdarensis]